MVIIFYIAGAAVLAALLFGLLLFLLCNQPPAWLIQRIRSEWIRIVQEKVTSKECKQAVQNAVESLDVTEHAEPLVDEKMESFFVDVKGQIPMAAMFLDGPVGDTLRGQAKKHLLSVIQPLQKRIGEHAMDQFDPKALAEQIVLESTVREAIKAMGRSLLWPVVCAVFFLCLCANALSLVFLYQL